jgi:hypothetical protein
VKRIKNLVEAIETQKRIIVPSTGHQYFPDQPQINSRAPSYCRFGISYFIHDEFERWADPDLIIT